jgi:hypothetical protein
VNNTPLATRPRFSGYFLDKTQSDKDSQPAKARLFLPGFAPSAAHTAEPPHAEVLLPGDTKTKTMPLRWNDKHDVWESSAPVPAGTAYRFVVQGHPRLDLLETVPVKGEEEAFNRVAPNLGKAPERSAVIADVYLDSLVDKNHFHQLKAEHNGALPVRHQFKRFGPPEGNWAGLRELLPMFQANGFSGLLLKPFIGGDNLSTHRYWTVDPYRLNDSFKDKTEFKTVLNTLLKHGIRLYADGAFINQGLSGVQMMSNLEYGHRSPYWNWFRYDGTHSVNDKEHQSKPLNPLAVRWMYPPQASETEKQTFGVLPTLLNPRSGHRSLDLDSFAIAIENDPNKHGYKSDRPSFIRLYDPKLEDENGKPSPQSKHGYLADNEASVYRYRFPVSAEEVREKHHELIGLSDAEKKARLTEWRRFRLSGATLDNSGMKWDGNIPVALMNTRNPEVQHYLEGAVAYWGRLVMNTQMNTVSRSLAKALAQQPEGQHAASQKPEAILRAIASITARPGNEADRHNPAKTLPPVVLPDIEALTIEDIQKTLHQLKQENIASALLPRQNALDLSTALLKEIPLASLPLPDLFKATLGMPGLDHTLQNGHSPVWRRIIRTLFIPFAGESSFGKQMASIRDFLAPPAFSEQLTYQLQQALVLLPADQRQKLSHPQISSLVSDQLGESLFLHLLTGLNPRDLANNHKSEKVIEEAFYHAVPPFVRNAAPVAGANRLENFLKQRLQTSDALKPVQLAGLLSESLRSLDPTSVAVAEKILQKSEYGLNWRIDAAKDVADMDRIRNAPEKDRPEIFNEEMGRMQPFWQGMGKAMRDSFPKSALIAELTDFAKLSNDAMEKKWMNKLCADNTFSSAPNMLYMYSSLMQLVNYAQRPDEYGNTQMSPERFIETVIRPMSQSLPLTALNQMQNMVSSHDYNTASHALMVNPALFTMDLLKWWGLKDDFIVSCGELRTKECFERQLADIPHYRGIDTRGVLEKLENLPPDFHARLSENLPDEYHDIRQFYDESAKKPKETLEDGQKIKDVSRYTPTPKELKGRFVDAFFDTLNVNDRQELGLPLHPASASSAEKAFERNLRKALKTRMMEPSEAKAMRGVIVNAVLALRENAEDGNLNVPHDFWEKTQDRYKLDNSTNDHLRTAVEESLWQALDKTVNQWGRHFGYQPPDIALQHVFENMDNNWVQTVPVFQKNPEQACAFKANLENALYAEMVRPTLPKLLRLFALQNALPGNPSIYLPDWFAQGGGEWTKNIFIQSQALIRVDKLPDANGLNKENTDNGQPVNSSNQMTALQKTANKHGKPIHDEHVVDNPHDADYQQFMNRAGAIFRTRSMGIPSQDGKAGSVGPGALNNGVLLDVPGDDEHGVLPIVRDNGREQVITLIYTGQPQSLDWQHKEGDSEPGYAAVNTEPEPLRNYRSHLKNRQLVPGRTYRDAMDGERFILDEHGALMSLTHPEQGIDINDCRVLIREPKQNSSAKS